MNKGIIFAVTVGLLVAVGLWFTTRPESVSVTTSSVETKSKKSPDTVKTEATEDVVKTTTETSSANTDSANETAVNGHDHEDEHEVVKPANEVYPNAAAALEAVKNGATRYDDIILEQFLGLKECAWCDEFYAGVNELMMAESSDDDLKSYAAEILALSSSLKNVTTLFDALEKSGTAESGNIYSEALEMAYGDTEVVNYLNEKITSDNKVIKEAALAALTNHTSPEAIDAVYKATIAGNNPDGFYSEGLGLGEMLPDEAAIPAVTDIAKKNDQYSHLAVKALLNYGVDGLKIVSDLVRDLDDASAEKLLNNAIDHVPLEEEVRSLADQEIKAAKTPATKKFWESVREEFSFLNSEDGLAEEEDEEIE